MSSSPEGRGPSGNNLLPRDWASTDQAPTVAFLETEAESLSAQLYSISLHGTSAPVSAHSSQLREGRQQRVPT